MELRCRRRRGRGAHGCRVLRPQCAYQPRCAYRTLQSGRQRQRDRGPQHAHVRGRLTPIIVGLSAPAKERGLNLTEVPARAYRREALLRAKRRGRRQYRTTAGGRTGQMTLSRLRSGRLLAKEYRHKHHHLRRCSAVFTFADKPAIQVFICFLVATKVHEKRSDALPDDERDKLKCPRRDNRCRPRATPLPNTRQASE